MPQRLHRLPRTAVAALAAVALGGAACGDDADTDAQDADFETVEPEVQVEGNRIEIGDSAEQVEVGEDGDIEAPGFAPVVEDVLPSVVAVRPSAGEGSGVIWDSDGTIVTNNHVVVGADVVEVLLADGTSVPAEVVATDPIADLAVLAADAEDLPAADFAEDLPEIGEPVIAVGNPLGFENTVTAGVVSGVRRSIPGGGPSLVDLVQTDAAISPGNSGGALVDADGNVVGINVAYVPPQTGAVALGFAIPARTVADVVDELLADGEATHAYLGISPAPASDVVVDELAGGATVGVAVLDVQPGGPAAEAGIRRGDVITEFGDDEITGLDDLFAALRAREPGDVVPVTVVRDGDEGVVEVELADWPTSP